jgi:hypothetical protein
MLPPLNNLDWLPLKFWFTSVIISANGIYLLGSVGFKLENELQQS